MTHPMKSSYKTGLEGEDIAKHYLSENGYEFVSSRYKTKYGELDLIMCKNNLLIFVEVKARNKPIHHDLLSQQQISRNCNAALIFIAENQNFENFDLRFDYIQIIDKKVHQHIENAWYNDN